MTIRPIEPGDRPVIRRLLTEAWGAADVYAVSLGGMVDASALPGWVAEARGLGVETIRVTTTNDNTSALRFYQRRGFHLSALRPGAVTKARLVKPEIPERGEHDIPIRDEIELLRLL